MRIFWGVHRFAPVAGLEGDMAWLSPQYRRWLSMLRLWNRLIAMENSRLTKKLFNYVYSVTTDTSATWCNDIMKIFIFIDLKSSYENLLPVNIDSCKSLLIGKQKETWLAAVRGKPKLRFYAQFKTTFQAEKFVQINLSSFERSVIAQIRYGILKLHVETGRFNNTKLEDRLCRICHQNEIEDELHFLFDCTAYVAPRNVWIENIYKDCPHFHYFELKDQLKYIFEIMPRPTSKFIIACLNIRNDVMYIQ